MPRYPRTRLNIVKSAIPLERYTEPLHGEKAVNPNNVKVDATLQLVDALATDTVTDRVQPTVETVKVQLPTHIKATVSQEQHAFSPPWADLDVELRRQQLLQANYKARELLDTAALGDKDQLRLTLGRLLPGEDLPDNVLAALGDQYSPESKLLIALLTKLHRGGHTAAASATPYMPTAKEMAVDGVTEHLEMNAEERQDDPQAQAAADLRFAADAEEVKEGLSPAVSSTSTGSSTGSVSKPPQYKSPVSDLGDRLSHLNLVDDDVKLPPTTTVRRRKGSGLRKGQPAAEPAAPPALSAQTKRWEEMRAKQPTLFRLTMKSQKQATPLVKYMHEMNVPIPSMGRGAGRFPTEHLKQAVLDWHEAQLLKGEGISIDDDVIPQIFVKKVQGPTKRPRVKKQPAEPAAAASDDDDDEAEADGMRWDIVTGEIGAGNDNPALVKEARAIAGRALKKGAITPAQFAALTARLNQKRT